MRVAESIILDALKRGGCIKTFYRMSSRKAAESEVRIPDGFVLESPGEREDNHLLRLKIIAVIIDLGPLKIVVLLLPYEVCELLGQVARMLLKGILFE